MKSKEITPRDSDQGTLLRLISSETGRYALLIFEDISALVLYFIKPDDYIQYGLEEQDIIIGKFYEEKGSCHFVIAGESGLTCEMKINDKEIQSEKQYDHREKNVKQVIFSNNGERIITLSDEGTVRIWDRSKGILLEEVEDQHGIDWSTYLGKVSEVEKRKTLLDTNKTKSLFLFKDSIPVVEAIEKAGRQLLYVKKWLSTTIFELYGDRMSPLLPGKTSRHQVLEFNNELWLVGHSKVFRVRGNEVLQLYCKEWGPSSLGEKPDIHLFSIKGNLWLGTNAGAYRIDDENAILLTDRKKIIIDIKEINGSVWIVAIEKQPPWGHYHTAIMKVRGNEIRKIHKIKVEGKKLVQHSNTIFLGTGMGIYRIENDTTFLVPGSEIISFLPTTRVAF